MKKGHFDSLQLAFQSRLSEAASGWNQVLIQTLQGLGSALAILTKYGLGLFDTMTYCWTIADNILSFVVHSGECWMEPWGVHICPATFPGVLSLWTPASSTSCQASLGQWEIKTEIDRFLEALTASYNNGYPVYHRIYFACGFQKIHDLLCRYPCSVERFHGL